MGKHYIYLTFGLLVIGGTAAAEWRGWGPAAVSEVKDVPRTVRDNPGSYRPHYIYLGSGVRRGK
jgi:hypothetical protein